MWGRSSGTKDWLDPVDLAFVPSLWPDYLPLQHRLWTQILRAWLAQILAVNRCSIDCVYTLNSIKNFINTIFCSYSDFIFHSQITTETVFKKEYTTQSTSLTLLAINKHLATHRHYFITDETALESSIPIHTQSSTYQNMMHSWANTPRCLRYRQKAAPGGRPQPSGT